MVETDTPQRRFLDLAKQHGALWYHDGNPRHPHAELTSGAHSSGYFNREPFATHPFLLDQIAGMLLARLRRHGDDVDEVDWVAGPARGAIKLGHDLARRIGVARGRHCYATYTEKVVGGDGIERVVFQEGTPPEGARVLLLDDVLTTGGSAEGAAQEVIAARARVLPWVAALINRSGSSFLHGRRVIALASCRFEEWEPHECPLCKAGSVALRPKESGNWERLTASY